MKIDDRTEHLSLEQRKFLLVNDFIPWWVGIWTFLLLFSIVLFAVPHIFDQKQNPMVFAEKFTAYLGGGFGLFGMLAVFGSGLHEMFVMKRMIKEEDDQMQVKAPNK